MTNRPKIEVLPDLAGPAAVVELGFPPPEAGQIGPFQTLGRALTKVAGGVVEFLSVYPSSGEGFPSDHGRERTTAYFMKDYKTDFER